jgi:signal transduction histidine kinase
VSSALTTPAVQRDDLAHVAEELSAISENLLASYARLERHAERVEGELVQANAELATRVAEVDALRAHLDAVHRALPCGVVVFRADGTAASANPRAIELLATREDDVDALGSHALLRAAGTTERLVECEAAGSARVLAVRRSPLPEGRGSVVTVDDRTEERRLATELAARSKMAALGTMAGGIAHEVRNPLNAVRGFAALLVRDLAADTRAHRFARRICQGVDEVDAIVESILGFASPERLARQDVGARAIVEEAVEMAREALPSSADPRSYDLRLDVAPLVLRVDRIKIRQALRNLVANALQAQPRGGRVDVVVRDAGPDVRIEVRDAGPGLPAAVQGRLGEPFLTTRAEGTGLGLALVYAIAAIHGGSFEIRSPGALGGADAALIVPKTTP